GIEEQVFDIQEEQKDDIQNTNDTENTEGVDNIEMVEELEEQKLHINYEPTTYYQSKKPERTAIDVSREDYLLLSQIDEFREKAQQLQELLITKESKVLELQSVVEEREIKAKELEQILNERQKRADGLVEAFSSQVDRLIWQVTEKIDEMYELMGENLQNGQDLNDEQAEELRKMVKAVSSQSEKIKSDMIEIVRKENKRHRTEITDLIKKSEQRIENKVIEKLTEKTEELELLVEQKTAAVNKTTTIVLILTIINLIGLVVVAIL
ncbi:MAG: hypothetical protein IKJ01_10490, partial [Lachnospiraceae bacterium]|nr:hypothetical protein [Lachnospiraceae bacterium]